MSCGTAKQKCEKLVADVNKTTLESGENISYKTGTG